MVQLLRKIRKNGVDHFLWKRGDDFYFVTSYANDEFSHETMAFKCDCNGNVTSFLEIGVIHGHRAHADLAADLSLQ